MPVSVVRADLRGWARTIVISDVHAHAALLSQMLDMLKFSERDLLVVVGDLLLKGNENLNTLRLMTELSKRPNVIVLGGNCDTVPEEILALSDGEELADIFRRSGFIRQLLNPLSPPPDADCAALRDLIRLHYRQELEYLRKLPDILDTPQAVFVHGGLPDGDLRTAASWDSHSVRKFDDYLHRAPPLSKPVIVGHWPCCLYGEAHPDCTPLWDASRRVLSIDGGLGVKEDGQLNAVVIPYGEFEKREYYAVDDLPKVRALSAQEESARSFYIRYGDDLVEALESEKEFTLVRHLRTSAVLRVLSDKLWKDESGALRCSDSTDWMPPVQPGDMLSLAADTTRGYLVKKNGAIGWYRGAVEFM